ncbi:Hsp33 family molecular chaperone HslO [Salinisphaera hydrothermalis]|uniref:33 kDa chaperonin n=1 Tax=Salinisphaera hydrothermalis (strain C41B8) TaxID=1304275 RepID=A0A084IKU9_SALHC|nr:Hsp33 family molecular chaperone HslO [Salinisphaera hydrothermalis]KEZ77333.1 HSP33-like chaperonin [Salinisphaera hydrothermalis C41B8]
MAADQLQRFLFDGTAVRGEIAQLESTYQEALANHDYPEPIQHLLGELLAACALLTATVKLGGTLGIEIRGSGAVNLLMAESNPGNHERAQRLRGIARFDHEAVAAAGDTSLHGLLGDGKVVITLDPREGRRYQGIVALDQPTIAGCVETYFAQSEQLPTRLWLAADNQGAAGLLLQKLPAESTSLAADADGDAWDRLNHLAATITDDELTGLDTRDVLYRLFHEEQPRLFDPAPVMFACTCSRERFGAALHQLGADELRGLIEERGEIETQCHFCNTTYVFSPADVEALIEDPDASSPTMH